MTEDEVVGSKFELSSTWLSDVDDSVFLSDDFGATDFVKKNSQAVGQKIGKLRRWKSIGEYGWCKASIPEADHIDLIRVKPWLLCTKPPTIHESFTDFRSRREREKMARIQVILEQAQMESEDTRQNAGESAAHRLSPPFYQYCAPKVFASIPIREKKHLHQRYLLRRADSAVGMLRAKIYYAFEINNGSNEDFITATNLEGFNPLQ